MQMVILLEKQSEDTTILAERLMLVNDESSKINGISHENKTQINELKTILDNNHEIASGLESLIISLQDSLKVFKRS